MTLKNRYIILIVIIVAIVFGAAVFSFSTQKGTTQTPINNITSNQTNLTTSNNSHVNNTTSTKTKKQTPKSKSYACHWCHGLGYYSSHAECTDCGGIGMIGDEICSTCQGTGNGKEKRIRCDGCGGDGILNPGDPGYGNVPISELP